MSKEYNFKSSNIYFRYLDDSIPLNMVPTIVGYEKCTPNKDMIGPVRRSIYTLHIVIKGRGYFKIAGKEYRVTKDQIFLITPSEEISYFPDKNDPWEYMWVEFNGLAVKSLCERANITVANPVHTLNNPKPFIQQFSEMLEESSDSKVHSTINVLSHLLRILSMLIHEHDRLLSTHLSDTKVHIRPIVEYIEQNIGDATLSLNKISHLFYMNASYLSRIFKRTMGVNVSKYITSLRMLKAFIMLKTKQFSITKISETIGYSSPFYFSKEFKRYSKLSPSQYIKEHADE